MVCDKYNVKAVVTWRWSWSVHTVWTCSVCPTVTPQQSLKVLKVYFGDCLFTWLCWSDFIIRNHIYHTQHNWWAALIADSQSMNRYMDKVGRVKKFWLGNCQFCTWSWWQKPAGSNLPKHYKIKVALYATRDPVPMVCFPKARENWIQFFASLYIWASFFT